MRIENTIRRYVEKDAMLATVERIIAKGAEVYMRDVKMNRALFVLESGAWIRVRIGDVTREKERECAITYKAMDEHDDEIVESILSVGIFDDDYEAAIDLLEIVGCTLKSVQENERTKILWRYANHAYWIHVDRWPWLEKYRFFAIHPDASAGIGFLHDACEELGVNEYKSYNGGVDGVFKKELGFELREQPFVRFDLPPPRLE